MKNCRTLTKEWRLGNPIDTLLYH